MEPVIQVDSLTKSFGTNKAVDGISVQVNKGEVFGFLGPNGSGKTTTIRMICGLLKPDSGSGTCLGLDIVQDARQIKEAVGYMTQRFSLYEDLSVLENLDFLARIYGISNPRQHILNILDSFEFPQFRHNQLAGELSGGWKQRLALAASALPSPKLLLLDEPTAGVDPKARRDFWDHIHRLSSEGVTTLVTTHYMDEAERCHKLAYLVDGKIKIRGTQDEIIEQSPLITYQVKGLGLNELAAKLRTHSAVKQVAHFGHVLHVSGMDREGLESAIKQESYSGQQSGIITSTLEDVFMSLSS